MNSQYKQSVFDIVAQNFGNLDEIVRFINDNQVNISEEISVKQILEINNPIGVGDDKNKDAIALQDLNFNNNLIPLRGVENGISIWEINNTFIVGS